jgi:hypothetical protein
MRKQSSHVAARKGAESATFHEKTNLLDHASAAVSLHGSYPRRISGL